MREEEIDRIRQNGEIEASEKEQMLRAKRMTSIEEVVEEVDVLVDTHFFNEFSETKSSQFLKKVIAHQSTIESASSRRPGGQSTAARRR